VAFRAFDEDNLTFAAQHAVTDADMQPSLRAVLDRFASSRPCTGRPRDWLLASVGSVAARL